MQGNVIGLLATVGFATPVRFAAGSTDSKPALTSLPRGNASLGHPPPAEKNASDADPWLSSSFDCVHSSSGFASQAWFLVPVCYVPVQVPVVGTQCPVGPVCVFPHSHIPMVVGYCSVIRLQTIWLPFLHSTISKCPAGLPQALSPAIHLPTFFLGSMVILLLCHKGIIPLPQLSWLKVLAHLLRLILCLGFLLQSINLSCLPELAQPRA